MLVFIPLLLAYTAFWSSVLVLKVPIPTPSPMLLSLSGAPSPMISLVSVVEGVNTVIDSFPAVSDFIYSVPGAQSSRYLDAPPTSPILPPLNLPICVPLDWPALSDFGHVGTGMCDRVSGTDLVIWDGPSESPNLLGGSPLMVDGLTPEDCWYFAVLVTSGVGFWLVCRLIAATILRFSRSASAKVRGHLHR